MYYKLARNIAIGLLIFLTSCQQQAPTEVDVTQLINEVKNRVHAFHAADTSLNADGMLDLLWPEFTMLADGNYITYGDVEKGTKPFMASLKSFHTEWKNLKVIPIGSNHAISSFIFTDSLVAKDGTITRATGPNTFVWEKRNEEWKVLYGDADHYPVE